MIKKCLKSLMLLVGLFLVMPVRAMDADMVVIARSESSSEESSVVGGNMDIDSQWDESCVEVSGSELSTESEVPAKKSLELVRLTRKECDVLLDACMWRGNIHLPTYCWASKRGMGLDSIIISIENCPKPTRNLSIPSAFKVTQELFKKGESDRVFVGIICLEYLVRIGYKPAYEYAIQKAQLHVSSEYFPVVNAVYMLCEIFKFRLEDPKKLKELKDMAKRLTGDDFESIRAIHSRQRAARGFISIGLWVGFFSK